MSRVVTILGCGSSGGVPRVGQGWGACDPNNPKNRRRRCSVLVEQSGGGPATRVLIDTSPDLREQLLGCEIDRLDAIFITHRHADHINGIDDVRPLVIKARERIPLYMDARTATVVRQTFSYIFETPPGSQYPPLLDDRRIRSGASVAVDGPGGHIDFVPFDLHHGEIDALGYRFGGIAYTPDLSAVPDTSRQYLQDLDLWIVDALRYKPHPSHLSLSETLDWIEVLKPRRAVLTNMHTDMDFDQLASKLPPHVTPAYDGLRLNA